MTKNRIAKTVGLAVGMSLAFGASTAGAQTIADLQAQINALLAQLAALQGGSTTVTTTACTFTRSLTIGARGADVTCLQDYLTSTGHFTFSGGSTGYFGPITRSAVAAWQAANGVAPAVGYFGPISQAKYSSVAGSTVVTGGTTTTTGTGVITTPGVEGTITASVYPTPSTGTKLYEGDSRKAVMGIELEAKLSDMRVERIKIQIPSITYYNEVADMIYIMDGDTVVASSPLNSSTVTKEGSSYYITLTGINYVISKDAKKVLNVAVDGRGVIDSGYTDGDTFTLTIPANGVRAVDGAGINQYSPTSSFSRSHTPTADLTDSASLAISLNTGSPDANQIICDSGSDEDECGELELAKINFKAEDDDVLVTDFVLDLVRGGDTSSATGTVAYLYDGSTIIGSASVAGTSLTAMTATFSDIDWTVPADTTRTLTVKMDVTDVLAAATTFVASTDAGDTTAENSKGTTVAASGSADGNTLTLRKIGPEVTLVSKSISTSGVAQTSSSPSSTSTLTATFNIKIKAVGGNITLGTIASGTPVFAKTGANNSFELIENGVTSDTNVSTSTAYTISTSDTTAATGSNGRVLAEGAETTIPVTFQIIGRASTGVAVTSAIYSVQFQGLQWFNDSSGSVQTTTFMTDDTDWRTSDVSFP